ncbi:tripartite tricarboxylate transporter substrate binding protein [Bordetella petrii]|uniref:tripartite tricarboxylate transporter substrate binding protein n=1 Tax=Bordetella petrii TaxID=94624 RepID=UPI0038B2C7A2
MNQRRRFIAASLSLAAGAAVRPAFAAAKFPERPVRLVVPYAPGGGSDALGRVVAHAMGQRLGVSMVVENRGGAGGAMGLEMVVRAAPDGYTLVLLSTSHASNGAVMKLNYDVVKDTRAIGLIASGPWVLVTNKATGIASLDDLLRLAREQPDALNYASSGTGSSTHLATELFAQKAGIRVSHIPYRSSGLALTDLLANRIQFMLASAASVTSYVRDAMLLPLCVSTAKRSPFLPDVPTAQEAGVAGFAEELWHGLAAPAGTPEEAVQVLNQALAQALQDAELRAQFAREGLQPRPSTPQAFAQLVEADVAAWADIAAKANLAM